MCCTHQHQFSSAFAGKKRKSCMTFTSNKQQITAVISEITDDRLKTLCEQQGNTQQCTKIIYRNGVCVKLIRSMQRWQNEKNALEHLTAQTNVVKIFGTGLIYDKIPYISMERACGDSMDFVELFGSSTDINAHKLNFFHFMIDGLLHLHDVVDISHGDIKLQNILYFVSGKKITFKFCDFEFASKREKRPGMQGTLGMIAPECFEQTNVFGKPVDVWSAALTIYSFWGNLRVPFLAANERVDVALTKQLNAENPTATENYKPQYSIFARQQNTFIIKGFNLICPGSIACACTLAQMLILHPSERPSIREVKMFANNLVW